MKEQRISLTDESTDTAVDVAVDGMLAAADEVEDFDEVAVNSPFFNGFIEENPHLSEETLSLMYNQTVGESADGSTPTCLNQCMNTLHVPVGCSYERLPQTACHVSKGTTLW
eukprot:CAMPEP_0170179658 /NCGR_PEP_ID=MMETSP0040_2-20121228/18624_1 /TAXON_ID=641309 /ORGANISM="Lotharella oceanica, Strain CCMP622" /LENGTH=111 /DNA_ID=CAMNT_0010423889 /DNA_START=494 /DNA_END=826 /DNA_ORIENTATION=+